MAASKGVVQINKIAAAQRQLDCAIRMFFEKEDELAVHTLSAAAFGILRDVGKSRGQHFTKNVFRSGIITIAKQYAAGDLQPDKKAMLEGSSMMPIIQQLAEHIREQGDNFDAQSINVILSKAQEHKLWLSQTTAYLKHADRDAAGYLSADDLDNEKILMATCAAYVEVMKKPTPEITAYLVFWSVKNDQIDDLAEEVRRFAQKLRNANETQRHKLCSDYIRKNSR